LSWTGGPELWYNGTTLGSTSTSQEYRFWKERKMLETGAQAPDFTLTSDYRGQKVVIYFYPKADTPGCTKQACAVRDVYGNIDAQGAVVIGISPDQPAALIKFRQKYELPFVLLSDPDHCVAEAYGAWGEKKRQGETSMGLIRSHFGVDEAGKLIELEFQVKPLTTADLALRLLDL
jgi:peroxiredoxin Q/BCP